MIATKLGTYSTGGYHFYDTTGIYETWFLESNSVTWKIGPSLLDARAEHACGLFTFSNSEVLIVAGGNFENNKPVLTTELLNLAELDDNNGWQPGPMLPDGIAMGSGHTIVSNGESLYYINTFYNEFYELICLESLTNCTWARLYDAKLNYPRHYAVALMLPDDMVDMVDCA